MKQQKKGINYRTLAHTKGIDLKGPTLEDNAEVREQTLRRWYADMITTLNTSGCTPDEKRGLRSLVDIRNTELYEREVRPYLLEEPQE